MYLCQALCVFLPPPCSLCALRPCLTIPPSIFASFRPPSTPCFFISSMSLSLIPALPTEQLVCTSVEGERHREQMGGWQTERLREGEMLFWSSVFNQLCSFAPSGNVPLDIPSLLINVHTLTLHLSIYFVPLYLVVVKQSSGSLPDKFDDFQN